MFVQLFMNRESFQKVHDGTCLHDSATLVSNVQAAQLLPLDRSQCIISWQLNTIIFIETFLVGVSYLRLLRCARV